MLWRGDLEAYIQCLNATNYVYALARRLVDEKKWVNRLKEVMECKHAIEVNSLLFDLVSEGIQYDRIPLGLADTLRKEIGKAMVF